MTLVKLTVRVTVTIDTELASDIEDLENLLSKRLEHPSEYFGDGYGVFVWSIETLAEEDVTCKSD